MLVLKQVTRQPLRASHLRSALITPGITVGWNQTQMSTGELFLTLLLSNLAQWQLPEVPAQLLMLQGNWGQKQVRNRQ